MSATLLGNRKGAAARLGITLDEYEAHLAAGEQWCTACRTWRPLAEFRRDRTRMNGRARRCRACRPTERTPRDPAKVAARAAVRNAVRRGDLPAPGTLPCTDCGHRVGERGDDGRRHEYDHHAGYDLRHWLDVQALCSPCHGEREHQRRKGVVLAAVVGAYLEAKS